MCEERTDEDRHMTHLQKGWVRWPYAVMETHKQQPRNSVHLFIQLSKEVDLLYIAERKDRLS